MNYNTTIPMSFVHLKTPALLDDIDISTPD
jgi:hypothetical protein